MGARTGLLCAGCAVGRGGRERGTPRGRAFDGRHRGERREEGPQRAQRHLPHLGHVARAEEHGEGLLAEPATAARVARAHRDEAADLVRHAAVVVERGLVLVEVFADRLAAREHALEARDDAVVSGDLALGTSGLLGLVFRRFVVTAGAEKDRVARLLRELGPREIRVGAEGRDGALRLRGERQRAAPAPREDSALAQRAPRLHHALGIDAGARADPVAGRARAVRAVEREHARLDGRQRDAAVHAGEALAHPEGLAVLALGGGVREEAALAELERELHRVREAALHALLHDDAIDDDVEIVGARAIEEDLVAEVHHLAVDARADEALAAEALQIELELAAAGARDGGQDGDAAALAEAEDAIDDLLDRLRLDALAAVGAVGRADPREEEAQVVGDFGDGADGGARALGEGALLDRDRRREALDGVDVRLRELLEELSRVSGEGLDVAPLPLGVDGVEGERGFAGSARPREHDEPVAWDREADVLEVVLAGAANGESVHSEGAMASTLSRRDPCAEHGVR